MCIAHSKQTQTSVIWNLLFIIVLLIKHTSSHAHLMAAHLMAAHLMAAHLMAAHLMAAHLMAAHLMAAHLMAAHLNEELEQNIIACIFFGVRMYTG